MRSGQQVKTHSLNDKIMYNSRIKKRSNEEYESDEIGKDLHLRLVHHYYKNT